MERNDCCTITIVKDDIKKSEIVIIGNFDDFFLWVIGYLVMLLKCCTFLLQHTFHNIFNFAFGEKVLLLYLFIYVHFGFP